MSLCNKRQKRALLVVLGLMLVLSICICFSVAAWDAKPQLSVPTSALTSEEKMERSAYDACAEQLVPPPKEFTYFPIEAWSIVPWPQYGYILGKYDNPKPAVFKEDSIYHVNLFVDVTSIVTEKEPLTEKITTTRKYSRDRLSCSAYYLGTENSIERWDVKIWDVLDDIGGCLHSKYMDPYPSGYVICQ